jgi:hypothetical protein
VVSFVSKSILWEIGRIGGYEIKYPYETIDLPYSKGLRRVALGKSANLHDPDVEIRPAGQSRLLGGPERELALRRILMELGVVENPRGVNPLEAFCLQEGLAASEKALRERDLSSSARALFNAVHCLAKSGSLNNGFNRARVYRAVENLADLYLKTNEGPPAGLFRLISELIELRGFFFETPLLQKMTLIACDYGRLLLERSTNYCDISTAQTVLRKLSALGSYTLSPFMLVRPSDVKSLQAALEDKRMNVRHDPFCF